MTAGTVFRSRKRPDGSICMTKGINYFENFPSKIIDGKMYNPLKAELVQEIYPGSGSVFCYLFCKSNGELFMIECQCPEGEYGPHSVFFTVGDHLLKKEIRRFNASRIPERALKFHKIEE